MVEAYSDRCSADTEPCAELNAMHTPHLFWRNGKTMDTSRLSQFGLTFSVLEANHGEELLTSFLAGFLVRIFPKQGKETGLTANVRPCGISSRESFAKYDPDTRLWRTRQYSLQGGLALYSVTWPRRGMMRLGMCSELMIPELHTTEKGSGYWPTPTVTCRVCTPAQWAHRRKMEGGTRRSTYLADAVRYWQDRYGTPRETPMDGALSPMFQEWLMGWPIDWTAFEGPGMDKFQQWCSLHGLPSTNESKTDKAA